MQNIVIRGAQYLIILFIAVYTWQSFAWFGQKTEALRRRAAIRQNICLFSVHFLGYLSGFLVTGNEKLILLYGAQAVYFLCVIFLFRAIYPQSCRTLANHMCMLLVIGFVMLARLSFRLALKQSLIVFVGSFAVSVIPWIMGKYRELRRLAWVYGLIGSFLLFMVFLVADTTNGAKLFFKVGWISVQPSEFVKLIYVFFIAAMFEKSRSFLQVVKVSFMAALHVILLVISKDLGGALIFALTYLLMLYVATRQPMYLFGGLACASVASFVAWKLFDHVQVRVTAWLDPWSVIDTKGYQIAQSLFAIGMGGFLGVGLYEGSPGQIPVVEQDFIFSAIAEEFGGAVAICVILICLGTLFMFLNIGMEGQSLFYRYLATGLAIMYGIQVFLTVGGAMKLIPSTGVTLPLVSSGGSSVLSTLCMFAVVQGLYIQAGKGMMINGQKKERQTE